MRQTPSPTGLNGRLFLNGPSNFFVRIGCGCQSMETLVHVEIEIAPTTPRTFGAFVLPDRNAPRGGFQIVYVGGQPIFPAQFNGGAALSGGVGRENYGVLADFDSSEGDAFLLWHGGHGRRSMIITGVGWIGV